MQLFLLSSLIRDERSGPPSNPISGEPDRPRSQRSRHMAHQKRDGRTAATHKHVFQQRGCGRRYRVFQKRRRRRSCSPDGDVQFFSIEFWWYSENRRCRGECGSVVIDLKTTESMRRMAWAIRTVALRGTLSERR